MINWWTVLQYTVSGALVSWPVFIAGLWFSHSRQSATTQKVADDQTKQLVKKLKDDE